MPRTRQVPDPEFLAAYRKTRDAHRTGTIKKLTPAQKAQRGTMYALATTLGITPMSCYSYCKRLGLPPIKRAHLERDENDERLYSLYSGRTTLRKLSHKSGLSLSSLRLAIEREARRVRPANLFPPIEGAQDGHKNGNHSGVQLRFLKVQKLLEKDPALTDHPDILAEQTGIPRRRIHQYLEKVQEHRYENLPGRSAPRKLTSS